MNRTAVIVFTCGIAGAIGALVARSSGDSRKAITLEDLLDKIEGGWAGQMIGVSYGAPTEFRYRGSIIPEAKLPRWTPEQVNNSLSQDDLYVDMTFAQVLDEKGLDATTEDFGAMFRNAKYSLWHANLAARRALKRGVPAALAGAPRYNAHANDIDFQIESDFIGMMTPGMPQSAGDIALRAGRVMNHGDGILGGVFVAGMYSAAFFEKDPRKVVEAGLASLPATSPYARVIADVLAWSAESPQDWISVWRRIDEKWNKREPCPEGALRPFNIDAKLNGAYIAMGLLYGHADVGATINISTRCGQDSDCNPSSAAGILGAMLGYSQIPDSWKSGIPAIADNKFEYTNHSFRSIVASTEKRAVEMARRNGGSLESRKLIVKTQSPKPVQAPLWDDYGSPVERVRFDDPRWGWKGNWSSRTGDSGGGSRTRISSEKGAEASITFEGTGAIISGYYLPAGGTADVYLDGKLDRTVDVYPDENNRKGGEAVWHAFGLKNGRHALRLVVRGERYPGSSGAEISIDDLVIFR